MLKVMFIKYKTEFEYKLIIIILEQGHEFDRYERKTFFTASNGVKLEAVNNYFISDKQIFFNQDPDLYNRPPTMMVCSFDTDDEVKEHSDMYATAIKEYNASLYKPKNITDGVIEIKVVG